MLVDAMTDDAVLPILQNIQDNLAALDRKVTTLDSKVTTLDRKVSGQGRDLAVVMLDVRMIRAAIHDMGKTRVTEGRSRCCTKTSTGCNIASPILRRGLRSWRTGGPTESSGSRPLSLVKAYSTGTVPGYRGVQTGRPQGSPQGRPYRGQ